MKYILDKVTSYNLFNYLFPGILFVIFSSKITHYSFIQQDIIMGLFFYYFIGLVISRVGSIVIEPLLRRISFVHFDDYKSFVVAAKADDKLELLSEVNNTYRTLCSLFMLLILLKLYEFIETMLPVLSKWNVFILLVMLFIIFLLSYRKQIEYISKRVKVNQ